MADHRSARLRSPHDLDIARLAVPAFGTLLAEPMYVLADTAIVGHLGTDELAGLALASTLLLAVHGICIFLAYGTTSAVSRLLGAGQEAQAKRVSIQGLWLAAGLGVGFGAVLAAGARPLLICLGGTGRALEAGQTYLVVSTIGLPFLLMTLAGAGSFHGRQNARTPLAVAVGGNVVNLALESILVFGLGFGVGASALATALTQIGTGLVFSYRVVGWAGGGADQLRPDPVVLGGLLRAGRPLVVRTLALRAAFTLATAAAARIGTLEVAAHQVALQVWSTLGLALDAVAIAGQSLTGRWLGAGAAERAREAARRMVALDVTLGLVVGIAVLVLRRPIAGIFTDDPALIHLIGYLLVWVALAEPMNGYVFALDGILIGAGDLAYLGRAMFAVSAVFLVMGAAVIATGAGLGWLWAALTAFMALRGVAVWWRWRSGRWLVTGATVAG
jgi:putative MATE family efflux protein